MLKTDFSSIFFFFFIPGKRQYYDCQSYLKLFFLALKGCSEMTLCHNTRAVTESHCIKYHTVSEKYRGLKLAIKSWCTVYGLFIYELIQLYFLKLFMLYIAPSNFDFSAHK